jgi:hypothetical protein
MSKKERGRWWWEKHHREKKAPKQPNRITYDGDGSNHFGEFLVVRTSHQENSP